jgi:hypothetical protein
VFLDVKWAEKARNELYLASKIFGCRQMPSFNRIWKFYLKIDFKSILTIGDRCFAFSAMLP